MTQIEGLDDVSLIKRVASGREDAFLVVYHRHAPDVVRYAWAVSSSNDAVPELVQDTFFTFWQKASSLEIVGSSLLPWLLVTCRNHAHNRRRKDSKWRDQVELHDGIVDERGEFKAQLRWVVDAIEALPENDRRVCELCMIEGYTYVEAAKTLGMTAAAVGKRLQRARAGLKGDLS